MSNGIISPCDEGAEAQEDKQLITQKYSHNICCVKYRGIHAGDRTLT